MTVSVPADRPAAELLAEWDALRNYERVDSAWSHYEHVLVRLARAEQALAEIEASVQPTGTDPQTMVRGVRASLRASQGRQGNCPAGGVQGDHESQWFEDEQSWRCLRCGRYFSNDAPVRASQGGQEADRG